MTRQKRKTRDFYPHHISPQSWEQFSKLLKAHVPYICLWTGGASKLLTTCNQGLSTINKEFFEVWAKNKTGFSNGRTWKFLLTGFSIGKTSNFLLLCLVPFLTLIYCKFPSLESWVLSISPSSCSTGNPKSIKHIALNMENFQHEKMVQK